MYWYFDNYIYRYLQNTDICNNLFYIIYIYIYRNFQYQLCVHDNTPYWYSQSLILRSNTQYYKESCKVYVAPVICFFQYLLWAICLRQLFFYLKVNYSFNHFLTTVNMAFVLQFCKTSVTTCRPKLNQWIKAFTTCSSHHSSKTQRFVNKWWK